MFTTVESVGLGVAYNTRELMWKRAATKNEFWAEMASIFREARIGIN